MLLIRRPFAWYAKAYYSHFYRNRKSYYDTFYQVVNVDQLLSDVRPRLHRFLKAADSIRIFQIPFEATPDVVVKTMGAPNFRREVTEQAILHRTTLFYKRPFFSDNAILQFNFLNDLFLNCTVTFIQRKGPPEPIFLKMINEKYRESGTEGPDHFEGMMDSRGNLLLYEESVYRSLIYVNAAAVHQKLEREIEQKLLDYHSRNWQQEYQRWKDQL